MFLLGTYIQFDPSFATTTYTYAGTLFTDLVPYLMPIIGVIIVALIVSVIIKSLHK